VIQYHYVIIDLLADYLEGELQAVSDIQAARWMTLEETANLDVTELVSEVAKEVLAH